MNERIRELAEQARVQDRGYFIYQYGGPTGHQSVEKAIDLEKFAELIVRDIHAYVDGLDTAQIISRGILKRFGVEEQVQDSKELHTCPYREEIHNDYESLCDCNEEQQHQCAMDI